MKKPTSVGVFWPHCCLSIFSLGDFVLIWWEYVLLITRHDIRPLYLPNLEKHVSLDLEKNTYQQVLWLRHWIPISGVPCSKPLGGSKYFFWGGGYYTKYKCIIFVTLWFYLNKWLCVLSVTIGHGSIWINDCVYSQLLLVMSLSGQKIGPGTCLPKNVHC